MAFQISALDRAQFEHLFSLTDEELRTHRARRVFADKGQGFPCRVSLADAKLGDELLLLHYEHQPVDSPFRSSYAIYVNRNGQQARPAINNVPELFRSRVISLRGFDEEDMLRAAEIADGIELESAIEQMFGNRDVKYIHLHYAKPGCYAARVDRS